MSKLSALFVLSCLLAMALALPEARLQQQRQLRQQQQQQKLQHPYLFFSVPRGRANAGAVVQGFEIVEEDNDAEDDDDDDDMPTMPMRRLQHHDDDDDDDDEMSNDDDDDVNSLGLARNGQLVLLNGNNDDDVENDDDDDDDDMEHDDDADHHQQSVPVVLAKPTAMQNRHKSNALNGQQLLKNAKPTQMMVARDQAGAIMVPDGIIEIEGQSVVDEKTGKSALLVPRAALDAIPDGAVVALMERSANSAVGENPNGEERANRVVVRRRKVGNRRGVQRRRRGGRPVRRRRRGNNRRPVRRNNRRRNVRVVRPNANRRRGGQRRRGQVMLQG